MRTHVKGWVLSGLLLSGMCHAGPELPKDALLCVNITSKLERLYCFDQVFATPLVVHSVDVEVSTHAVEWLRATKNETNRQAGSQFLLGRQEDNNENTWLTASAIGAVPPRPILMLSCIDGISRVELVLSRYFAAGSMRVAVNGAASTGQAWQSDNSGYIFRTGRGLPAIKIMKSMLAEPKLVLHSDIEAIDGLQFDTAELEQAILPLRKVCRW